MTFAIPDTFQVRVTRVTLLGRVAAESDACLLTLLSRVHGRGRGLARHLVFACFVWDSVVFVTLARFGELLLSGHQGPGHHEMARILGSVTK